MHKLISVMMFVASMLNIGSVSAADLSAKIQTSQDQIVKLQNEILVSTDRIRSSIESFQSQELAYDKLIHVSDNLTSINSELDSLNRETSLSALITEPKRKSLAIKILDNHRTLISKLSALHASYAEKSLGNARDEETTKFLLAARDIFKEISEYMQ